MTTKASVQLQPVDREDAVAFTSGLNNSDIISHGIGPNPIENIETNKDKDITGSICNSCANLSKPWLAK